jgi:hypothetical protein
MVDVQAFDDALSSIFAVPDPFAPELAPGVERAAVLYPLHYYGFAPDLIPALSEVSQRHGESVLYIAFSEIPDPADFRDNGYGPVSKATFPLSLETYQPFVQECLQNAHVAGNATWGALFSSDEFAVLAGRESFLTQLEPHLPASYEEQAIAFLRDQRWYHENWKFGIDWIPPVIRAVFGSEHGARLLAETDFEAEPRREA